MRLSPTMPVLRDPDGCGYFKEDAGNLLVGWFEPVAKPWGMGSIPESFCFDSLPADFEHIEPLMAAAAHRMPLLAEAGIRLFFNGPESFTPDDRYLLGESPDVRGMFVAAGFNSIGIQSAGGAGKVLADWIVDGRPPMDLWDVDVRRVCRSRATASYLHDRTVEALGLLYAMHWPYRQPETARGVRRSPVHDRLAARGACFGETAGWERANWFAPDGVDAGLRVQLRPPELVRLLGRRAPCGPHTTSGCSTRHRSPSSGSKDRDAERVLNQICANDIAVPVGKIVYTQWLNDNGGIEADLTVTREAEDRFLIVTAAATQVRDLHWLKDHIGADDRAIAVDVTSGSAVFSVMGPNAAHVPASRSPPPTCPTRRSRSAPRRRSTSATRGCAPAASPTSASSAGSCTSRPSSPPASSTCSSTAGDRTACGSPATTPSTRCAWRRATATGATTSRPTTRRSKPGSASPSRGTNRTGSSARTPCVRQRDAGVSRRLVQLALVDSDKLLYHNEPIWRDGVDRRRDDLRHVRPHARQSLAMGYVTNPDGVADAAYIDAGNLRDRSRRRTRCRPWPRCSRSTTRRASE